MDAEAGDSVTMVDVLEQQAALEEDAHAVLGGSDDKECTYQKGYVKRQALYACLTCCPDTRAGLCLACSLSCHENHELVELYTKRNFRCDCGGPLFPNKPCSFGGVRPEPNSDNKYNQNFSGLYCKCSRPYPDPEGQDDDEMIQCIVCEDWLHSRHLNARVPPHDRYSEMICEECINAKQILKSYLIYKVPENGCLDATVDSSINSSAFDTTVDITTLDATVVSVTSDTSHINEKLQESTSEECTKIEPETSEKNSTDDVIPMEVDSELPKESIPETIVSEADKTTPLVEGVTEEDIEKEIMKEDALMKPETEEVTQQTNGHKEDAQLEEKETIPMNNIEITESDVDKILDDIPPAIEKNDISEAIIENKIVDNEDASKMEAEVSNIPKDNLDDNIPDVPKTDVKEVEEKIESTPNEIDRNAPIDNSQVSTDKTDENVSKPDNETVLDNSEIPKENILDITDNDAGCDSLKRKIMPNEEQEICDKKSKLDDASVTCKKPEDSNVDHKGAVFWPCEWRTKLCCCSKCNRLYKEQDLSFLLDNEDTVDAYENLGKMKTVSSTTQYEKGLEALSSLDRIQQINAITEYNKMKEKLMEFLKTFQDKSEVVREEDIKGFFAGMKPKREPDGVYFCR